MATSRRADISEALRQRVLNALHFRTLGPGRRLPSARALAGELRADPRVVLAAYGALEREGLVERRPGARGFFVARGLPATGDDGASAPTAAWLVDVLAGGLARGVRAPDFPEHARRGLETLRLRAACVECNRDQLVWLEQEVREDYGIAAAGVDLDELAADDALPSALRTADLLVTTRAHEAVVRPVAERLGRPLVAVGLRADLVVEVERRLAAGPVYFVGTDPRFADKVRRTYAAAGDHARPVLVGRDDARDLPAGAPAWVMRSARQLLGGVPPQLRPLSTLRAFDVESQRAILRFVVEANLQASRAAFADRQPVAT